MNSKAVPVPLKLDPASWWSVCLVWLNVAMRLSLLYIMSGQYCITADVGGRVIKVLITTEK